MAVPLTLAMSINVAFLLGAVFVPGLWAAVEYLFPLAILAFLRRWRVRPSNLHPLLHAGLGGRRLPLSGEQQPWRDGRGRSRCPRRPEPSRRSERDRLFFAILFASIAIVLGLVQFVLGFQSMQHMGVAPSGGPSLWIMIPILTLLGIAMIDVSFGCHRGFNEPVSPAGLLVLSSAVQSLQILFGVIGDAVMQRMGYFRDFLRGDQKHPGSYALVCPGVALLVFGMFVFAFGLQRTGLLERFALPYFVVLAPLVYAHLKTVMTMLTLNSRLLGMGAAGQ